MFRLIEKRQYLAAGLVVALSVIGSAAFRSRGVQASPRPDGSAAQSATPSTTQKDQIDLAVTVYNSNVALVRDVRQLSLPTGSFSLKFEDVAASITPQTVHFRSLSEPTKLSVVEQNYEYDLLDPAKLLQKYVGREVTLVRGEEENNSTKWIETKALLLSDNNGPVWKIGDEIVTGMPTDNYRFPDLPENLYSKPTLVWMLENGGAKSQRVEASYLTNNMNWNADYVLTVTRDEKSADLDGWVTLANNSGAAYKNAKLQLVAGEVHRAAPVRMKAESFGAIAGAAAPAAQFEQENFSEYHLYSLARRTSIEDKETKQISLLNASGVSVEKLLLVTGQSYYYRNSQTIGNPIPQAVQVDYRFKNEDKSGLGMPLPAGTVRVYQADSHGGIQLVGEDNIHHTPKDEAVTIHVGDAFDIVCERKETDVKKISNNVYEFEYEITLRNHKESDVTVEVREPIGGDWEIEKSNYKADKLDSTTLGFQIPVAKNGTSTLDYRVRVKW
ncbi:MAG: DUF4139 domain-containing protein [Candidatus Acidiferrales bacterium]|jgi:hypothetical protein